MTYDIPGDQSVSEAVVTAVATCLGTDPVPSESTGSSDRALVPLYDTVDPEALDALGRPAAGRASLTVTFEYEGCVVTVEGDERIVLDCLDEATCVCQP